MPFAALSAPFLSGPRCALLQAGLVTFGIGNLLFYPPMDGRIAYYPLTRTAAAALPAIVAQGDRRIVARTGFPGAYVTEGPRPALWNLLIQDRILAVRTNALGCIGKTPRP